MEKDCIIDIIMLSNYGKKDGGRETWLYNFLPELLKDESILRVHLFGYKIVDDEDNVKLLEALDPSDRKRVRPIILEGKRSKYPMFLSMYSLLKKFIKKTELPAPNYTIAVGGMFEGFMLRSVKRFKNGTRIIWLRSIFIQEKAYRIPIFGVKLTKRIEKAILQKMDIIIVNGDDTRKFYKQYGFNLYTIKNAINPKRWNLSSMSTSHTLEVAFIGRLSKVKGIEAYLELARRIKNSENKNKFVFHVVGHGEAYLNEVKNLNKENIIQYHGALNNEDLPQFLSRVHICVALGFVSYRLGGAGLSNALLEQMAAQKIIVAWSNDAYNQILDDRCAYLVKQYNIEGLENVFIKIYYDQPRALIKAKEAKVVVAPYTIKEHVLKFRTILAQNEDNSRSTNKIFQ